MVCCGIFWSGQLAICTSPTIHLVFPQPRPPPPLCFTFGYNPLSQKVCINFVLPLGITAVPKELDPKRIIIPRF